MSMICSAVCCWRDEKDKTVGTSTNCSAFCGRRTAERSGILSDNELLNSALRRTLSVGKALKASQTTSTPTTRNWNVDVLHCNRC